jgi:limonene-1,2-epoxide hydrolase
MTDSSVQTGGPATAPKAPEEIVMAFYDAWDTVGFEQAYLTYLHPNVRVENPALPVWEGRDTVMKGLALYMATFKRPYAKVEVHNLAVNGNTVLTERTEHNRNEAGDDVYTGDLMTVFVIEDDLIIRWAEYYDPTPYKFGEALPHPPLEWTS